MAGTIDESQDVVFRAVKRRKVQRTRRDEEDDQQLSDQDGGLVKRDKRSGGRRTGVAFSNNDRRAYEDPSVEMALVPSSTAQVDEHIQNDRFVKPTGRAGVIEDKHMVHYIDSKLAELRSAKPSANDAAPESEVKRQLKTAGREPKFANEEVEEVDIAKLRKPVQTSERTGRVKPGRRRRGHIRDEKDVARDALIDQIMKESQVPIYDQSVGGGHAEMEGEDHDEAVAEAFKAEFLEELEERKRRKANTATAGLDKAGSGPRLGGSRSQRARMKAEEESKPGTGKK